MEKKFEQSSRFLSLSGLSGIFVGLCGLLGTYVTHNLLSTESKKNKDMLTIVSGFDYYNMTVHQFVGENLIFLALFTILFALLFAFYFTTLRSRKNNYPIWDDKTRQQISALSLPSVVGGIFIIRLVITANYGYIVPVAIIFYAISLINIRRFSTGEVGFLGYILLLLGIVNLWKQGWGILFFGFGFGFLHIVYGVVTFFVYERHTIKSIKSSGRW